MAPGAQVMAPCRVENASLSLPADPCPRLAGATFGLGTLVAVLEHNSVALVVAVMDVGFVPTFETAETVKHRLVSRRQASREDLGAVALELGANQVDELLAVAKAIRRAVQRHKALTPFDKRQQSRFLFGGNRVDVGIEHQAVVLGEIGGGEQIGVFGVVDGDAAPCAAPESRPRREPPADGGRSRRERSAGDQVARLSRDSCSAPTAEEPSSPKRAKRVTDSQPSAKWRSR